MLIEKCTDALLIGVGYAKGLSYVGRINDLQEGKNSEISYITVFYTVLCVSKTQFWPREPLYYYYNLLQLLY